MTLPVIAGALAAAYVAPLIPILSSPETAAMLGIGVYFLAGGRLPD